MSSPRVLTWLSSGTTTEAPAYWEMSTLPYTGGEGGYGQDDGRDWDFGPEDFVTRDDEDVPTPIRFAPGETLTAQDLNNAYDAIIQRLDRAGL